MNEEEVYVGQEMGVNHTFLCRSIRSIDQLIKSDIKKENKSRMHNLHSSEINSSFSHIQADLWASLPNVFG